MNKTLSILTVAAAALVAAPSAAQAQSHRCSTSCQRVVSKGHYKVSQKRVRVPGGFTFQTRTVRVPGHYVTKTKTVNVPGRYVTRNERVWVPGAWVSTGRRHRNRARVDVGPVSLRFKGRSHRGQRWQAGHWETQCKRVWIAPRCERQRVQVWVPACNRTERVRVRCAERWEVQNVKVWVPGKTVRVCHQPARRVERHTSRRANRRSYRHNRHNRYNRDRRFRVTAEFSR
jgi:hypothetical protein